MTQTEEYPLPTVHLNGTPKEVLLEGNEGIIRAIFRLKEAINNCVFHGRDYYVHPLEDTVIGGAYGLAADERQKHLQALADFEAYIQKHYDHINGQ
jgi:hypothetical protein